MTKARLFSFTDSQTYFRQYGIDPDKHFDRLCRMYGSDFANERIDENMRKAWEDKWKRDVGEEKERQRILTNECPFE